jgi:hypothetical protein
LTENSATFFWTQKNKISVDSILAKSIIAPAWLSAVTGALELEGRCRVTVETESGEFFMGSCLKNSASVGLVSFRLRRWGGGGDVSNSNPSSVLSLMHNAAKSFV